MRCAIGYGLVLDKDDLFNYFEVEGEDREYVESFLQEMKLKVIFDGQSDRVFVTIDDIVDFVFGAAEELDIVEPSDEQINVFNNSFGSAPVLYYFSYELELFAGEDLPDNITEMLSKINFNPKF